MNKKGFLLRAVYSYGGEISAYLFLGLTVFALAKGLQVEEFGRINLLVSIVLLASVSIDLGLPSFVLRYVGEHIENNQLHKSADLLYALAVIALCAGALVWAVLTFFGQTITFGTLPPGPAYAGIVALFAVTKFLSGIMEMYLSALYRDGWKNSLIAGAALLKLLLILLALHWQAPLTMLFILFWSTEMLSLAGFTVLLRRFLLKPAGKADLAHGFAVIREKAHFIIREYLYKLLGFLWDPKFDLFLTTGLLGLYATGSYSFAMGILIFATAWSPDSVLQPMLRAFMVRQYASRKNIAGLAEFFRLSTTIKLFFMIPLIGLLTVLCAPALRVFFAGQYPDALPICLIFAPFLIFKVLISPIREVLITLDRNDICLRSHWALAYKFLAVMLIVPRAKIYGLAFACSSFFLVVFILQWIMSRKVIRLHFEWAKIRRIGENTALSCLTALLLSPWAATGVIPLICTGLASIALYLAASFINKPFDAHVRKMINEAIGKPMWIF